MLTQQRIKEAQICVNQYLTDELLCKVVTREQIILDTYIKNALESRDLAIFLFDQDKPPLWIITISYYAMFYSANAVLYKLGYKTQDKIAHKVTADALIIFVRSKITDNLITSYEDAQNRALSTIKADEILQNFDNLRRKRNKVQYNMTHEVLREQAKSTLKTSKEFVFEMSSILRSLN